MKKGILVYTEEDAKINKWFITSFIDEFKKYGVKLELFIVNGNEKIPSDIDFCINRSRIAAVNKELENKGIPCFNNGKTIEIANDKWLTYVMCRDEGIPVMETKLKDSLNEQKFPFIIKSRNGHGGSEVMLIENEEQRAKLLLTNPSGYILQKPCSTFGLDVRVYIMGGKVISAVKRTSETDFRSNFSLGGKVELFTPVKEQLDIIEQLNGLLNMDYAGVDFIMHEGNWVLNEIEDAVGARMLYSLSDFDVIGIYTKYIMERIV